MNSESGHPGSALDAQSTGPTCLLFHISDFGSAIEETRKPDGSRRAYIIKKSCLSLTPVNIHIPKPRTQFRSHLISTFPSLNVPSSGKKFQKDFEKKF